MPRFVGLVVGALAAMLVALPGGQAFAAHVACGDVITHDTTLDSDLVGCSGTALTIGADYVTLDLGGHRVGDCCYPDTTGIDDLGRRGVVIENGQVLGVTGIRLVNAHETVLRDLDVFGPFAITLSRSTGNRLETSIVGTSYVAVSMEDSDYNAIRGPPSTATTTESISQPAQTTTASRTRSFPPSATDLRFVSRPVTSTASGATGSARRSPELP